MRYFFDLRDGAEITETRKVLTWIGPRIRRGRGRACVS